MDKPWLRFLPAILGFVLYIGTLNHGFVLDDNLVITENTLVNEGVSAIPKLMTSNYGFGHGGFNDGLYRPLSLVSFAIEKTVFDLNPKASHFINALLYGLLILLLFNWLEKLFENRILTLIATILFAAHPIHTEVVANLKSRDEIFALLFFLGSGIYFLNHLKSKELTSIILSTILFGLSLFSKESSITFLAVFPLMIWFKNGSFSKALPSVFFLFPAILFLSFRFWVLQLAGEVDGGVSNLLQNPIIENDGFLERLSTAAAIQWLYLSKLFVPLHLSSDYSFSAIPVSTFNNLDSIFGIIIIAALLAYSVVKFKQRNPAVFGILFYFITIAVVANLLILIGAIAAERFVFTPSVGWAIAIGYIITQIKTDKIQIAITAAVALLFGIQTMNRAADWESNFTLFTADVNVVEQSARAHYNAGTVYNDEAAKDPSKAKEYRAESIKHLNRAIEIWPEYQDAYNNLSITYLQGGQYKESMQAVNGALKLNPNYSKGYYNLAVAALNAQEYATAEQAAERYMDLANVVPDMLFTAAEAEGFQGKFNESIAHLQQLIQVEPSNFRGYFKLGMALAISGQAEQALPHLEKANSLSPNNTEVLMNLTLVCLNTNRTEVAKSYLDRILNLEPQNQQAIGLRQRIQVQ